MISVFVILVRLIPSHEMLAAQARTVEALVSQQIVPTRYRMSPYA